MTFAQETAMTIFAPDFAMPFASDLEPTCQTINITSQLLQILKTSI